MRIGSVCSGVGTPELSWSKFGGVSQFLSEIDAFPAEILNQRFPEVTNLGDMTTINGWDWRGKIDVFVGGTPCQAFSVAGARNSLEDDRGNLALKFVTLADEIDAPITVWENVRGVLSTDDNAFGCLLGGLCGAGFEIQPGGKPDMGKTSKYWRWNKRLGRHIPKWARAGYVDGPKRTIAWRVLDAQYFGVAQRRERVFVVASARAWADSRKILFEYDGVRRDSPPSREPELYPASAITSRPYADRGAGDIQNLVVDSSGFRKLKHGKYTPDSVASTVKARDGKEATDLVVCVNARQDPIHVDNVSLPLGAMDRGHAIVDNLRVRRLMPIECERLQGLPDNWTQIQWKKKAIEDCPLNPRYKAIGNGMCLNCLDFIGGRIYDEIFLHI